MYIPALPSHPNLNIIRNKGLSDRQALFIHRAANSCFFQSSCKGMLSVKRFLGRMPFRKAILWMDSVLPGLKSPSLNDRY
jgi:hypothetical protein